MPLDIGRDNDEELENQLNKGALWAVTYGDLMSYMMLFFLLMFSFSISEEGMAFIESLSAVQKTFGGEENKELTEKKAKIMREEELAKEIQGKFQQTQNLKDFTEVQMTEEKIKITLREGIVFDAGGVELDVRSKEVLHEVAEFVRPMPNRVIVEGHTDNMPIPKNSKFVSNWVLSMARAYKVLRYFVDEEKIDPKRLSCVGYGEYHPLVDNDTPEGRSKNRRIEITLMR